MFSWGFAMIIPSGFVTGHFDANLIVWYVHIKLDTCCVRPSRLTYWTPGEFNEILDK